VCAQTVADRSEKLQSRIRLLVVAVDAYLDAGVVLPIALFPRAPNVYDLDSRRSPALT